MAIISPNMSDAPTILNQSDQWQRALSLMDTAAAMSVEARAKWLEDILVNEPQVAPLLQKLLNAHKRVETKDILATLPRLQPSSAAKETGEIGLSVGPFELVELLGRGGMGSVWRARYADGRLKRDVAVKLPAKANTAEAHFSLRERFSRERDFLAQLEHPNIARLYDAGVSETGQPFLAMEFVQGTAIDTYCDDKKLKLPARITLFLQVCDAVEFAHRQLVLHRDLKPANVLIDAQGTAHLLDFGVAKLLPKNDEDQTETTKPYELTQEMGTAVTLAFAAPEQLNNGRLSTATDVYALGIMLYRLLTGMSPYQPKRDTRGALEDEVMTNPPALASTRDVPEDELLVRQSSASALKRQLAGDIDTILAKAMKKDAQQRYLSAAAFSDDLRRFLNKQPILARPDTAWYRLSRMVVRHRVATTATALGAVALIGTAGIAVWQARAATASAAVAVKEASRVTAAQKFMSGIFANADPEQNKGAAITAREILDHGRDTAERDLAADPEAHALVLTQIGDIYFRLGIPDQFLSIQRRRVAVLEAYAAANPNVDVNGLIDAQLALGQALGYTGVSADGVEATRLLKATYDAARLKRAAPDRIVWATVLLGDSFRVQRKLAEAAQLADEAVLLAEKSLTTLHPKLAASYELAAVIARDQGRIDDARKYFAKVVVIDAGAQGRTKTDQATTRINLAQMEYDAADYLTAMKESLAVIEFARKNVGDSKFNLATPRRLAVLSAERAGKIELAQQYTTTLLADEINAAQPMRVAAAHMVRARVALTAENMALAAEALKMASPTGLNNDIWSGRVLALQAELILRKNKPLEAEALLTPLLAKQIAQYGAENAELAPTLEWLGVAEAQLGKTASAQLHFLHARRLRAASRAPLHPLRVRCEAYVLLIDGMLSKAVKHAGLEKLETDLARGRIDQLALLPSLRAARKLLEVAAPHENYNAIFPILN